MQEQRRATPTPGINQNQATTFVGRVEGKRIKSQSMEMDYLNQSIEEYLMSHPYGFYQMSLICVICVPTTACERPSRGVQANF